MTAPLMRSKLLLLGLYCFITFMMIFIAGLRVGGTDYEAYAFMVKSQSFDYFSFPYYSAPLLNTSGNEFLWATIASMSNSFNFGITGALFLSACVSIGLKSFVFLRASKLPILSLVIFAALIFHKELGQVRHALMLAFFICSLWLIAEGKLRLAFFSLLAGAMCHPLGAVGIIMFSGRLRRFFLKHHVVLLIFSIFIFINGGLSSYILSEEMMLLGGLTEKVVGYSLNDQLILSFFTYALMSVYCFTMIQTRSHEQSLRLEVFKASMIFGVLLYFAISDIPELAGRSMEMFTFSAFILLLPDLVRSSIRSNRSFHLVMIIFIAVTFAAFIFPRIEPFSLAI